MKTQMITNFKRLKIADNRGAALIFSYLILAVLLILMSGFGYTSSNELASVTRIKSETTAFWIAEAGLNRFLEDTTLLDGGNQNVNLGGGTLAIVKDDTNPQLRLVTATGTFDGVSRALQIDFSAVPPDIFNDTFATGGDIRLNGLIAQMDVFGKTRLTGTFSKSLGSSAYFEDKVEGVDAGLTTLKYPDVNNNSTADEFADFVQFNQNIVSTYPSSEIVYIQDDNTQVIIPNSQLAGKKVIYVEGSTAGSGDVDIWFDAAWQSGQNLTVISTGTVDYIQPLNLGTDSQLNIIAWDDYEEASVLYSSHDGVTYAHDEALFFSVFSFSETKGNVLANTGITANEALSWKKFIYENPIQNGAVPPGFEGLISTSPGGYASTPNSWKEL